MRSILADWRENWRRYLRYGLLLYIVIQALQYLAQWFERTINSMA